MLSLLDLPPELIHHVYHFAHISVVCRLRLTCRALCKLGDEHLLPEVHAFFHEQSLNIVEQSASSRPAVRSSIKSLYFQPDGTDDYLADLPNEGLYQFNFRNRSRHFEYAQASQRCSFLLAKHGTSSGEGRQSTIHEALRFYRSTNERAIEAYSSVGKVEDTGPFFMVLKHEEASEDSALSSAFQHYNRLIVDEHRVRNGAIVRARLKALFLACPNLTKLSFNMKDILHPNKAFENPEWLCGLRVPHGAFDSGPHVFGQALLAAYDASLDLRDLSVGIVSSISMKDVDTTLTLAAIKNLTRLHWKCEDPDSIDEDLRGNDDPALHQSVGGIQDSHLATRLSNCPRLETLLLDLSYRSSASSRVDLRLLFPHASVLRHLRRVRMTNFQATPERLSSFLLNHALTLQYLHLHNVHLYEHDEGEQWREQPDENGIFWQTCIEAFAGNLTHLKEVRLTGRFTSHASNGLWYYGRKSRSCSGEDGYERSSSEVIDYILTSTCQYYFPAPSFDVDLARMTPMWDPEDDDTWGLSSSSSGEDDATEDDDDVSESDESDSEDEEA